ncbi:MAG: hypothetical protein GY854_18655 [Deltaproteobacteria bacterium]|nr:hypothetical protein [Deltaproteobacteria bacterium]
MEKPIRPHPMMSESSARFSSRHVMTREAEDEGTIPTHKARSKAVKSIRCGDEKGTTASGAVFNAERTGYD